jgi:hypothetical protein
MSCHFIDVTMVCSVKVVVGWTAEELTEQLGETVYKQL